MPRVCGKAVSWFLILIAVSSLLQLCRSTQDLSRHASRRLANQHNGLSRTSLTDWQGLRHTTTEQIVTEMQQEWHAYLDDQDSKPMMPEEEEFLSLLEFASQAISTSSHSNTLPPLSNFHTDDRFGAGIAEKLYAVDPVKVIALPVAALSALNNPSPPSQDTLLETRGDSLNLQDDQSVMRAAWGASVDSLSKFVDPPKPDWTGLMREAGILPASAVGSQDAPAGAELDVTTRDDADGSVMRFRETNGQMHLHLKSAAKNGAPVEEDTLTLNVPAGKGQANQLVKGVVSVLEQEAAARRTEVDTQDGADNSKPKPAPLPLIPNLGQMINRPQPPKWLLKNFLTEDCVACRMIWTQVERDVSDTKDEREVQDSFVHHCIDAQQSSIFYTACSEMFDDKKLMIRDYVTGRHDVKSICGRAQFCKWPKPETIENFAGPRLDGQQRKELLSKSFQGGGGYRGFFKWVRRSPHDKLKGKKSKDVDAFGLLGKVKALVGAAAKAKVVKGGGIVKMKAQKKKGGKKKGGKGGKGGKKGGKKGGGGGKKGGGGGGKKGGGGGKGGKKGGLLKKIVKAAKKAAGALGGKGGGGGGGGGKKKGGLLKKVVAAVKGMLGKKGGGGGGSAGGGGGGKKKKDGFWKKLVKAAKKLVKKIAGKKKK